MISFDNTEIAFASKKDYDLKWAQRLFKLIGSNFLVKVGKVMTPIALKLHLPIKGIIKRTIFRQFCGGENIEDSQGTIDYLAKYNIGTILDYSVEGKNEEVAFDETCKELLEVIERAKSDPKIPFSVFKVTGITTFSLLEKLNNKKELNPSEKEKYQALIDRVDSLCKASYEAKTPIFIDAEESWIQDAIDQIAESMMEKYNQEKAIVYNTIQLYRKDRLAYLKNCYQKAEEKNYYLGVKLVRGAYMEKERDRAADKGYPSPIQDSKAETDQDYNLALEFCIEHIERIAICAGTHNEDSSAKLADMMNQKGISKDHKHLYFAQLLGMSDHISFILSDKGYNVAKYVPYGPIAEVLPYLIRRAEENTSVAGQTSRELSLINREISRRKSSK